MSRNGDDDQPDLDLIALVQRARMQHDADAQPSQIPAVYWIEAKFQAGKPLPTPRAGYFLIRTTLQAVDALWAQIRGATEGGVLGYKSKVSTASRGVGRDADDREIRVQTYDADDGADVERVRAALIDLGVTSSPYTRGDA